MAEQTIQDDITKKCYSCGKTFKTTQHLARHKRRKTPCLIREIAPQDAHNPLRCIYCNKIFSKKENLTRHLRICKVKNGGMSILDDKIRYEEKIRILEDQRALDVAKIQQLSARIDELGAKTQEDLAALKQAAAAPGTVIHHTTHNTTHNTVIHFHNYDRPKVDTLHITQDDLLVESISKKIMELIYFNPSIPENHVLYRPNIKEQRLLVYKEGGWRNIGSDSAFGQVMSGVKNVIWGVGCDKINTEVYRTEDEFARLYPVVRDAIYKFNGGEPLQDGVLMDVITDNRELIRASIRGRGGE